MSNDEAKRREDEAGQTLALFRYQVIAPLVESTGNAGTVASLVREIVAGTHYLPHRGVVSVKERTVYQWLRQFRNGGLDALLPKRRSDWGSRRALSDAVLERAIALRTELQSRNTSVLIDIMKRESLLATQPSFHRATLDRHLDRRGASRRRLHGARRTIAMEFKQFGDLWVGDYHHGPLVRRPDSQVTTAKLGAFIDHKTRYPVAHRYYLSENLPTLRDTLYRAFLRFGLPSKIYVDNGKVYRSRQLGFALKRVKCDLVHSKPYYSEGRGVIEKWWQVATPFEAEVAARDELLTIHELNVLWEAYCEERYCQVDHSSLGISPAAAIVGVAVRAVDPQILPRLFLVRETRSVHKKSACVGVLGVPFLCESFLRGRKVEVEFDPSRLEAIDIFYNGERIQRAFPQPKGEPPEPHVDTPERPGLSTDYLELVRRDYDRRLLEQARPLAYADLEVNDAFDGNAFASVIAELAGLDASRLAIAQEIAQFWEQLGPLPEDLTRIGVEHVVRLHGRGRHPRVYLHAIRTLVLAHWRSRPSSKENER